MINIINEKRVAREVVRVTGKTEFDDPNKKPANTSSFILRSLICDDKEVYIKYISEGKADEKLTHKVKKILNIMDRMLKEPLENICGGFDKIPEKYRGKKLVVLTGLPYTKDTVPSSIEEVDGTYVKKNTTTPESLKQTKRATVIKLYLAIEE